MCDEYVCAEIGKGGTKKGRNRPENKKIVGLALLFVCVVCVSCCCWTDAFQFNCLVCSLFFSRWAAVKRWVGASHLILILIHDGPEGCCGCSPGCGYGCGCGGSCSC